MANFRRSQRYRFHLRLEVQGAAGPTPALTHDVSYHGAFVRTDEVRAVNQLVRFRCVDPPGEPAIDLVGIVARCVPAEDATEAQPPGIGVSLFGNRSETETRWLALVRRVQSWTERGLAEPPTASPALKPPPLPKIDSIRRRHVRRPSPFNVTLRPQGVEALANFEMRDISEGGTFVLTRTLLPVGSEISLQLVHPETEDTFRIAGHVVRSIDSADREEKGIGIRFDVSTVDRGAWDAFIARNAPASSGGANLLPLPEPGVRIIRTPPPAAFDAESGDEE